MSLTPGRHFLSNLYGRVASWRRASYARHPDAQRRLAQPVISVGNLSVGGSGKTPLVAALARWLVREGERPAILTRGYGRRVATDGVLVVSDTTRVLEPVERSGDEPQMLARALPGVPVLVSADRYLAGVLAERTFGADVHLLDDGFQHFAVARDVDLLIVTPEDLQDAVLPAGRLREPLEAMSAASAIITTADDIEREDVDRVGRAFRLRQGYGGPPKREARRLVMARHANHKGSRHTIDYRLVTTAGAPRVVNPFGEAASWEPGRRAVAVAGIARPQRFFATAREQGWDVAKELTFRDHHWFTAADVAEIVAAARAVDADVVLTTEKDAVRLAPLVSGGRRFPETSVPAGNLRSPCTFAYLPIDVRVEPEAQFFSWLSERLAAARALRGQERA